MYELTKDEQLDIDTSTTPRTASEFLCFVGIPAGGSQVWGGKSYIIPNEPSQLNIITDKNFYSGNNNATISAWLYINIVFSTMHVLIKEDGPLRLRLYWR